MAEEFYRYCALLVERSERKNSRILHSKVSTLFKFYNAMSTFTSRPELVLPTIRSTDFGWGTLTEELLKGHNPHNFGNPFDYFYSQIYYEGKSFASLHVAELSGSLHEDTIKAWISPEYEPKVVSFVRFIYHKPLKDSKSGGIVKAKETWDFKNHTVVITTNEDDCKQVRGCYFPTIEAKYDVETATCTITVEQYVQKTYLYDIDYYAKTVIPKLFEWMSDDYKPTLPRLTRQRARPLTYISNSQYWELYDLIKSGSAQYVKSIWKESTDPVKFIHEDIGIASYIACVIQECSDSKFRPKVDSVDILDFGCGNGLLCYFLYKLMPEIWKNSTVTGFDVRRRQIWSDLLRVCPKERIDETEMCFQQPVEPNFNFCMGVSSNLDLLERAIVPHMIDDILRRFGRAPNSRSKAGVWLIGNHSDELTPWIPVMARLLNANGFFIIPCCPYDFFKKYQRRANLPGTTTYQNYVEYICSIGDEFGYQPTLENLRIPSTKKICLVGVDCSRKFEPGVLDARVKKVMTELIKGETDNSLAKFVPRPMDSTKESPNIDRKTAKPIVDKIFNLLIKDFDKDPLVKWYAGRDDITFNDIFKILTPEDRDVLKNKGNGLKTLIKSNRHLFTIDNNIVKLRTPDSKDIENVSESSRDKIKTQPCYFNSYHPHGCPLRAQLCAYKHQSLL